MKSTDLAAQIARLLEDSGLSPEAAARDAEQTVRNLATISPGTSWGHMDAAALGNIWKRAARAGRRRLVLEIASEEQALEDDTGRVNITVLEVEDWPEWTPEHAAQRGATDALLGTPRPAPALPVDAFALPSFTGWTELDTAVEEAQARDAQAPARARAEDMN